VREGEGGKRREREREREREELEREKEIQSSVFPSFLSVSPWCAASCLCGQ
jgi:hypothetical protein